MSEQRSNLPRIGEAQRNLAERLGYLVMNFSELEYLVSSFVAFMIAPADMAKGRSVSTHLSIVRLIEVAKELAPQVIPSLSSDLVKVLNRADALRLERNAMVHSFWTRTDVAEDGEVRRGRIHIRRRAGRVEVDAQALSVSDVEKVSNELFNLIWDLNDLLDGARVLLSHPTEQSGPSELEGPEEIN